MALKASVNSRKRNTRSYHNNRANQLNPNNDAYWKREGMMKGGENDVKIKW